MFKMARKIPIHRNNSGHFYSIQPLSLKLGHNALTLVTFYRKIQAHTNLKGFFFFSTLACERASIKCTVLKVDLFSVSLCVCVC